MNIACRSPNLVSNVTNTHFAPSIPKQTLSIPWFIATVIGLLQQNQVIQMSPAMQAAGLAFLCLYAGIQVLLRLKDTTPSETKLGENMREMQRKLAEVIEVSSIENY
jgi:uncharacterized membrane protein YfbV (UPF0208 family)